MLHFNDIFIGETQPVQSHQRYYDPEVYEKSTGFQNLHRNCFIGQYFYDMLLTSEMELAMC